MIVEEDTTSLKEGEGFMVKAGLKHMHTSDAKLWMLVISKWPHEHIYFDL
jgi:quercetin dioxygenase-like cupin family protein